MKNAYKICLGIGITGAVIGIIAAIKKLGERLARIQSALYDLVNFKEEEYLEGYNETIATNIGEAVLLLEGINNKISRIDESLDEVINHTDDIASNVVKIGATYMGYSNTKNIRDASQVKMKVKMKPPLLVKLNRRQKNKHTQSLSLTANSVMFFFQMSRC